MSGRHDYLTITNRQRFLSKASTMTTMMMLIMIVQPVVNSDDSVIWQATVATGNAQDAGTNGTIYLTFKGTANTSNVHLTSLNGILFQRGQVDKFKIYTDYIGQLLELTIIHAEVSSSFTYLKWQLDYFLLLDLNTSTEYGFHYGNYIPENSFGYGELVIQPDTIRQLTNKTIVSSSMDPSVFSTQNLFASDTSTTYSQGVSSVFNDTDTSGFASGTVMIGSTPTIHTVFNGFASPITPFSFLLPTASTLLPNPKTFSSLLDPFPTNDVPTTSTLFPTRDISFTPDTRTLFTPTILPDSTTDGFTEILESSLRTTPIYSSRVCPTTGLAFPGADLSSRMASVSQELAVDRKELSVYKRKKSCAPDDRNSAKAIGFVALFVLALPIAFVILIDLSNYSTFLPKNGSEKSSAKEKRIEQV